MAKKTGQFYKFKWMLLAGVCAGSTLALTACGDNNSGQAEASPAVTQNSVAGRWYTQGQVSKGYTLFQANCAVCHKPDASGTLNWRNPDAQGKYPPPPLNGTAHTWHHPLSVLRMTVQRGGIALGGSMPGYADRLSADEIDAILAWVQSRWPDEIYVAWSQRNAQAGQMGQMMMRN